DDDTQAGGNAGGTGDDADAANLTGTLAASGGDGPLTWALSTAGAPAGFSYVANGTGINVFQGATLVMQVTLNTATGAYTVSQVAPIQHAAGSNENNQLFTLSYTVTDQDGDSAPGTLTIDVDDDTPVLANDTDTIPGGSNAPATGNVLTDASAGDAGDSDTGADSVGADGGSVTAITGFGGAGTIGGTTNGQYGVLTLNSDGSYSYTRNAGTPGNVTDTFTYTVTDGDGDTATATLTITIQDATPVTAPNLTVLLDDDALANGIAGGTGDVSPDTLNTSGTLAGSGGDGSLTWAYQTTGAPVGFTYVANGTGIDVFQGATKVLVLTLNTATGAYSVTQVAPVMHAAGGNENTQAFTLNYSVTDSDGDSATGSLAIQVNDDSPIQVVPTAISVPNTAGAAVFQSLDPSLLNNYGADGGTVRFSPTLEGTNSGLSSSFVPIIYHVSPDGLTLTGVAGSSTIFTITLVPGTNQYSVDLDGVVDSLTTISFEDGVYEFIGGNTAWVGFVPNDQDTTSAAVNDNSRDLLITPSISGANSGTINGSSVALGVGSGNDVGPNEMVRIDFVVDLVGNTSGPGGYGVAGNRDHTFDSHYTANGASALLIASAGSTVRITARDDFDADNIVGDGTIDPITKIVIAYDGVASAFIIPTTTPTDYTVNGKIYTVTLNSDGSVNVAGVEGTSGAGAIGTQIAAYTLNGYSSLEFAHVSGDPFKLGNFGAVAVTTNPVSFTVPVEVIDNDGDVSPATNLAITLTPVAPPIALDLDGNGVQFLSTSHGVAFDYDGDGVGEGTAWVAANDGILAIDRNGDGMVNDGSEIVFGGGGQTDLQGLAANFDSNEDGLLDANDAAFGQFGVWQDANSDGVAQVGEYRSLNEMGITSIDLTSDGRAYAAADGTVQVAGESSYTMADGSTGIVADASFALDGERRAARSAELVAASSAAATGLLAAMAMEHASAAADDGLARHSADTYIAANDALFDTLPEQAQDKGSNPEVLVQEAPAKAAAESANALDHTDSPAMHDGLGQPTDRFADLHEVAGNDGSRSALFGTDQAPSSLDASLVLGAAPGAGAAVEAHPALLAALADGAGAAEVDSIVEHFAPNSAGATDFAGNAGSVDLQGLLSITINGGGDSMMPHIAMLPELDHDVANAMT
ncbi:VCBS domain-containing protein, partial [Novosphingobium sp.]|uniref:beta strand repeat-containing protein n=1 Tax=Novosphingobium sp. TaxID=1874826 RepID=UPI0025DF718B